VWRARRLTYTELDTEVNVTANALPGRREDDHA
jgi:hypothetical protein